MPAQARPADPRMSARELARILPPMSSAAFARPQNPRSKCSISERARFSRCLGRFHETLSGGASAASDRSRIQVRGAHAPPNLTCHGLSSR